MIHRKLGIITLMLISQISVCQTDTETGFKSTTEDNYFLLPDEIQMKAYHDSLKLHFKKKLLTGYTFSVFNEVVGNAIIKYSFDNESFQESKSDSHGRFFIVLDKKNPDKVRIKSESKDYHDFDTTLSWQSVGSMPVICWLHPKYKIVLRGRAIIGNVPVENVHVQLIHKTDTFRTSTHSCYTDNEGYWNCLYLGMFKQEITFDNPDDSVLIHLSKSGIKNKSLSLSCGNYDGNILSVKLKYESMLPKLYHHHIGFRILPPILKHGMVSVKYEHLFKISDFDRLGAEIEAGIYTYKLNSELPRSPDPGNPDTNLVLTRTDTTYVSAFASPNLIVWLTNPKNRKFAVYAGVSFPYYFAQKDFYIHPFLGGQIYLDLNKAVFIETRYVNYKEEIIRYNTNNLNVIEKNTINEPITKLYINVGLIISF